MHTPEPIYVPASIQRHVMELVLWGGSTRWWTVPKLAGQLRDPIMAMDAMATLGEAGLIHRQGIIVLPTPPARYYHNLLCRP